MKTQQKTRILLLATVMVTGLAGSALADDFTVLPQPTQEGSVSYVTGGVGEGERDGFKFAAKDYNLQITNANPGGHLVSGTDFTLEHKSSGRELTRINNSGPLVYAKVPAGSYTVEATNGDQHQTRKIKVVAGKPAKVFFTWQQE